MHHRNQPTKTKLALYKPLLHFKSHCVQVTRIKVGVVYMYQGM